MNDLNPDEAGAVILEAVENQIKANDPPKVKETIKRLMAQGIEMDDAKKFIACALSVEVFAVAKHSEKFNAERYNTNLDTLPEMPWEDE